MDFFNILIEKLPKNLMPYPHSASSKKNISLYIAVLAAIIAFIIYLPALGNGFVNWDDPAYVIENQRIRNIGPDFFIWVFTNQAICNYHPMTIISHAADYAVFGLNAWGHHLVNIVFHGLNTFLTAILGFRIASMKWSAAEGSIDNRALFAGFIASLLFAVHPLHVESVAWVAERKDVLSTFFFILSILFYLRYAEGKRRAVFYGATLAAFLLALLSKPMAITLPFALLILDFYPLERIRTRSIKFVLEKIPFFALSALSAVLTILSQKACGALSSVERYSLPIRAATAIRGYAFYLYKTFLPFNLAPYYPHPVRIDFFTAEYLGSLAALIAITAFSIIAIRRHKAFTAAWAFYLLTLSPVIGLVQVGGQAAADRYMYLPSLSPFFMIGLGAGVILADKKRLRPIFIALALLILGALSYLTLRQVAIWKDPVTFWSHEIRLYPKTVPIAYGNRAMAYEDKGLFKEAIDDYTKAIGVKSGYAPFYLGRGGAYNSAREYPKAIEDFNTAIALDPKYAEAYSNRGNAYWNLGDPRKAIEDYRAAIRLNPGLGAAYHNLALAFENLGDLDSALKAHQKAKELGYR